MPVLRRSRHRAKVGGRAGADSGGAAAAADRIQIKNGFEADEKASEYFAEQDQRFAFLTDYNNPPPKTSETEVSHIWTRNAYAFCAEALAPLTPLGLVGMCSCGMLQMADFSLGGLDMKCWTILALAGVIITPLSAMAATFSDTEFADADWTAAFEIVDQTSNDTGAFTGAQASPGGNPGNYRQVSNFMNDATPTGNRIAGGHLKIGAVYDPGVAGALSSITFSFDLIGLSGPAGAMGAGFLIEQGGKYFGQGVPQAVNGAGWQSRGNTGQVASDFVAFDGISTLDFSASGGALTFGFYSSNGTRGESLNIGGVDNWSVTLAEAPDAVVPLPATLPFLLSAIAGLALMNRRRSWSERATSGRTSLVA